MRRLLVIASVLLVLAPGRAVRAGERASTPSDEPRITTDWSTTLFGQYRYIEPPMDDDDVGGWFDQYEFTPNKSSSFPFELGIREARVDVIGKDDLPFFQLRLESPTSNLGVSGRQIDEPFFNQRLDALTRIEGLDFDLRYWRMRTEQLRVFPNTAGAGLVFNDFTDDDDRFYRDRTGFEGEVRLRPYEAFEELGESGSWLAPELSLRGGYEWRDGTRQLRFHRDPSNTWIGLPQDLDRSVWDAGGGVLVAPWGRATLTLDFDHERLRMNVPFITEGDLGYPPPRSTRTIGFIPDTNRSTGTIRFNTRVRDRAVIEAGFQISELEQVDPFTPNQGAAGLEDNRVRTYAANVAFDLRMTDSLYLNSFFKFDQRDNDIDRDTALFNRSNGTQVDPFIASWQRFYVGGELELRLRGSNRAAFGVLMEDITRERQFSRFFERRILRENTFVERDTRIFTMYGRVAAKPWRSLRVDGELGYRKAPKLGYATELDDNLYGELRASYLFSLPQPLVVTAFLRGSTGENDTVTMVDGRGPVPNGQILPRSLERSNIAAGLTASIAPVEPVRLYASIFYGRYDQDATLDYSNSQRYFQDNLPLRFTNDSLNLFENEQLSVIFGSHFEIDDRTDAGIGYSFTRVDADYTSLPTTQSSNWISANHGIDSDTHAVDFEVGHWVMDGLRVLMGYRFQYYDDRAPVVPASVASAVAPFDRSTLQHTVTLGVTLTSDFFTR